VTGGGSQGSGLASTPGSGTIAGETPHRRASRRFLLALLGLAALAFAIRLVGELRGGGLLGDHGFDDGVYIAAAISFVEGKVPYKDFNLLHPPGIIYLLSPFGLLGGLVGDANVLAAVRVSFMALGAVNTMLVGLVGRKALGPTAGIVAAAIYAVWIVAANVERTAWLVGPQTTLLLVALFALAGRAGSAMTWRRGLVAGLCLGVSGAIQVWSLLPALVIFAWLVVAMRRTPRGLLKVAGAYVLAGLAAVAALLGPLLVVSGPRMLQLIIWTQLSRDAGGRTPLMARIRTLEGLPLATSAHNLVPSAAVLAVFVAALVVATIVAWRRPTTRLWAALLFTKLAFLLYMSVFFRHYSGWVAPEASLLAGAAIAMLLASIRYPAAHRVVAAAAVLGVLALAFVSIQPTGRRIPVSAEEPDLTTTQCVSADAPLLLIRTQTLRRNLERGCPLLLNPGGLSHIINAERSGPKVPRRNLAAYQDALRTYFTSSDAVLLVRPKELGLTDATWQAIRARLPVERKLGLVTVLSRDDP
jgi:alpha-1,2-mannosyltransferase